MTVRRGSVQVQISRYVFAPAATVWEVLTDWEGQADWMVDARDVRVVGQQRTGEGVRIVCPTNVLGFTVRDEMEVTAWVPQRRLAVAHRGSVITGSGVFDLEETAAGTRVTWTEEVTAPLGAVGETLARGLVRPYLRWLFGRSLTNLKRRCERRERADG